jgi:hypothetical protein
MLPSARCPVVPGTVYTGLDKAIPIAHWYFPPRKFEEKGSEFEVWQEVRLKIA